MAKNSHPIRDFISAVDTALRGIDLALLPTCGESRVTDVLRLLEEWHEKAFNKKKNAQSQMQEDASNLFFSIQCYLTAIASLIHMWQHLKSSDPNTAWDKLIDAQEYAQISLRANFSPPTKDLLEFLEMIEKNIFPKVAFVSAGFIHKAGTCSVCGERIDKCKHEEGSIYMGKLCVQLNLREAKFDHVAMVENPRDKRCRMTSVLKDGYYRDHFSGEIVKDADPSEHDDIDGLRCKMFAFNTRILPGLF